MEQRSKRMLFTLVIVFFVLAILQRFTADTAITTIPWWVATVILAAIISGYMWIRTSMQERKAEAEWIEQEGRVYIRRMEKERAGRSAGSTENE
ncbi:uncharacterized membrane protein YciS (DUF1049 family) [Geomicrobium halophilum]|uniref:Uncharacterized membrane protein YciS (DUF1049 family) n=1 Tax=Geomicrobium halophilum TaxID=549000 RepID=A0A841PYQ7_9BACL|nr:sporulation YhaL family protein [Geomicrobium halophilum]MBB6449542.1 uncharacterized membrane protein YciS (DUF1049 family) [Geomicrobium halophilum]